MSEEEKLQIVLSAIQLIAVSTSDVLTAKYCVKILEEVEDKQRLDMLREFYDMELN